MKITINHLIFIILIFTILLLPEIYYYNISITWSAENKHYYFSKSGKSDDEPRFNVISESHLQIEGVQLEDAGDYLCTLVSENYGNEFLSFRHHVEIFGESNLI